MSCYNQPAKIGGGVNLAEWCRFGGDGVDAARDVIKLGGDSDEEDVVKPKGNDGSGEGGL